MEKKIKVGDKEFTVKEIKYKEMTKGDSEDKEAMSKNIMLLSTGMSEDDYNDLTIKEGIAIMAVVNDINGLQDFQNPQAASKTS